MAVIEKIRSKGGLLIGIVGFSLLAFLLGDLFSSQNGLFSSNDITAGEIAGTKINAMDFEAKVEVQATNYKMQTNTDNIDQNTMDQIREQTWGQLVEELVFKPQYDKLGLSCSAVELVDMVQGKNPHPQIKQAFTDPKTGTFNPANVANFLKNMDNDQTGRTRNQWLLFEKAIREERVKQKYNNLIRNGLFVSNLDTKSPLRIRLL
ncbi:MAG: SurA N-terminal domain-containing protein, partial [Bacteroidota bacterium]